ncbi:CxC2 domain-containing protein [Mycena venus]|uniref:CxC2 domain-containing protein n=1 Tax=Mycena venus TaxID=2733690 RepID=A0A8H6Z2S6_9AGAR|nr:CxC2 domain-containing protein [Mycena venus]
MASSNISGSREGNRQMKGNIEYEIHPQETSHDRGYHLTSNGSRKISTTANVRMKKQKVALQDLADLYGAWIPAPGRGEDYSLGDEQSTEEEDANMGEKRKHYLSSDEPNVLWRKLVQQLLDTFMRCEGLGDSMTKPQCAYCQAVHTPKSWLLCSEDCGVFLQCHACAVERHAIHPLHRLWEWNGTFWTKKTLYSLNCVYQLGHGGFPCKMPSIARNGCRDSNLDQLLKNDWYPGSTVDPATCVTFRVLELFHLLNVVGNINVHDFIGTLERETDACHVGKVPDRYKDAPTIQQEWRVHLRVGARCGAGHAPMRGVNLPDGWWEVSPEFRFLYMLILAMDANFRLKNRLRVNEHDDPSFGSGLGYLVEEGPYKEHLRGYVGEPDVSTCIVFMALMQKDTRLMTGLRASGMGGVVCARHELVRPQGVGDLQKGNGEYSNMDYIFLSSIIGVAVLGIIISYDIACQWKIGLPERLDQMPEALKLDLTVDLQFGLPVWHAAAHEKKCQAQNSLTYVEGAGRTDGEGIERTWLVLNPLGWATKEMGNGARHDALEDKIDHHNFEKNIGQGETLARRLVLAIDERDIQVAAFREVDVMLRSSLRKEWQAMIDAWRADPTKPNPYEIAPGTEGGAKQSGHSTGIDKRGGEGSHGRGETAQVECNGVSGGGAAARGDTVKLGSSARRRDGRFLTTNREGKVEEMRIGFLSKLRRFRELQRVYTPGTAEEVEREEEARDPELPLPKPEDIKLFLPSRLRERVWEAGCKEGITRRESKLHEGQCWDSLHHLRSRLHCKRHLINNRNEEVVGQRASTWVATLIGQVGERVDSTAAKYRRMRMALLRLKGIEHCEKEGFKELQAADITLDEEREADAKATKRLGLIGVKKKKKAAGPALSLREQKVSWIWTSGGGPGKDKPALHEAVCVDWARAQLRKCRWEEEVQLLREEMRCVLRYLRWQVQQWELRRAACVGEVIPKVRAGLEAYAARQAALYRDIAQRFKSDWDALAKTVLQNAVLQDEAMADIMASFSALMENSGGTADDGAGSTFATVAEATVPVEIGGAGDTGEVAALQVPEGGGVGVERGAVAQLEIAF